jgi:hypothetical protein
LGVSTRKDYFFDIVTVLHSKCMAF